GYYVELGEGLQWVQIDLGAPAEIHAIALWHYHAQARAYHDVIVQLSDDPEFKSGGVTVFNNDHDNSAKMGKGSDPAYVETNKGRVTPVKGTTARCVRLYSKGNSSDGLNPYVEVEVFGGAKYPRRADRRASGAPALPKPDATFGFLFLPPLEH